MDEDKKYVRVAAKLFVEQTDKVGGGIAIVQSQRAAQPSYSGPLSGFRRDLGSSLGQVTSAQPPRNIQLALKLYY